MKVQKTTESSVFFTNQNDVCQHSASGSKELCHETSRTQEQPMQMSTACFSKKRLQQDLAHHHMFVVTNVKTLQWHYTAVKEKLVLITTALYTKGLQGWTWIQLIQFNGVSCKCVNLWHTKNDWVFKHCCLCSAWYIWMAQVKIRNHGTWKDV